MYPPAHCLYLHTPRFSPITGDPEPTSPDAYDTTLSAQHLLVTLFGHQLKKCHVDILLRSGYSALPLIHTSNDTSLGHFACCLWACAV